MGVVTVKVYKQVSYKYRTLINVVYNKKNKM